MNKFKSKYDYKNRFNTDDFGCRSSDDCDISQKIKSLEIEGLKLRSQVEDILQESSEVQSWQTFDMSIDSSRTNFMDSERRECAINNNENVINETQCNSDNNQHRIDYLHQKMRQNALNYQIEREKIVKSVEELKKVNYKLQCDLERQCHDCQVADKQQQMMIERLRSNLTQLLTVNKKQEETLLETGARLEEFNESQTAMRSLEYLRDVLSEVEYNRGVALAKENDIESASPNLLVNIVEKCFKEYNCDLENRSRKIKDLEDEIIQIKRTLTHDKEKAIHEMRNQFAYVEEQNNYLKQHINEINQNTDEEIERLREENSIIKMKMEEEMANATKLIDGLEQNLQELSNKNRKANESWTMEKKSFEKILDNNEKQIAIVRAERDQSINQRSSLTAKLDAAQNQLSETETTLLQLQSEKYSVDKQVEIFSKRSKEMENSITSSRKYFENIIKTVRSCGDCVENANNNYENINDSLFDDDDESEDLSHVWKPKKYLFEEAINKITTLSKRERDFDCEYKKMKQEYEQIRKALEAVDLQRRNIEQSFKAQQLDIDSSKNENAHLSSLIANRNGEIERLTAERDYYFELLNEKTEEVAIVKTDKHRLAASQLSTKMDLINVNYTKLEERCRVLETQCYANQSGDSHRNNISEPSLEKNRILREDRDRLASEIKELKASYEDLLSKQHEESRNLKRLRQENWGLQKDLTNTCKEYDELIIENKKISIKLKDSEHEITNLCRQLQDKNVIKSRKQMNLEKKVMELESELTSNKNELKISHERIKYLEKGISKSNSQTQQHCVLNDIKGDTTETDNLKMTRTRLNGLEQQMSLLDVSQKTLKEENYKLTDLLKKVTFQNERMSQELENYVKENKMLRSQVSFVDSKHNQIQRKNEQFPKKQKNESNNESYQSKKHVRIPSTDDRASVNGGDESIKQLRQDLQHSIIEARRLLSSTPIIEADAYNRNVEGNSYKLSQTSSKNESDNGSNNNNISKTLNSETVDSSTINTRRSESTSLTEADRYISLPLNKNKEFGVLDERAVSPIQKLLAPKKSPNISVKKSSRDSYLLEEKIKRLLETES